MSSLEEASELGYKDKFLLKPNWQLQLLDNYFKDQKKKKIKTKTKVYLNCFTSITSVKT